MNQRKQEAFTLVEILVIMAIIGLALAVIPPALTRALPGGQVRSAVRYLASGLKMARVQAISSQHESVLCW